MLQSLHTTELHLDGLNIKFACYDSPSFLNSVKASSYYVLPNQDLFVPATLYSTELSLILVTDTHVVSPNPHDFTTVTSDIVKRKENISITISILFLTCD